MDNSAELFRFEDWWEKFLGTLPVSYISAPLIAVGSLLMYWRGPEFFRHSLGEALVVAGILVWIVDPFVKGRLSRHAIIGIFHLILGFDQQPEIKARLKELIFNTRIFRKGFYMKCTLIPDGGKMRLKMEARFEVINPTNESQQYRHLLQFEREENAIVSSMTLVSEADSYTKAPEPRDKADDPEVVEYSAGETEVLPGTAGRTYNFTSAFEMEYPLEFFYALHVGIPTIGITVEVEPPEGFKVSISPSSNMTTNICTHNKLFMPGEHIDIRWRKYSAAGPREPRVDGQGSSTDKIPTR